MEVLLMSLTPIHSQYSIDKLILEHLINECNNQYDDLMKEFSYIEKGHVCYMCKIKELINRLDAIIERECGVEKHKYTDKVNKYIKIEFIDIFIN